MTAREEGVSALNLAESCLSPCWETGERDVAGAAGCLIEALRAIQRRLDEALQDALDRITRLEVQLADAERRAAEVRS